MPKQFKPFKLTSDISIAQQGNADNAPRTFSGVANSGKPFEHWGYQHVVDMDGILASTTNPDKLAVLYLHKRESEVGYGKLSVENNQLLISGTLLSNERATAIASSADEGFPWQMSAHVVPSSVEEVKTGTVQVNGQTLSAPINVLRKCKIAEVSFTPTGVDDQTHATVLSDDGNTNQSTPTEKETTMTLEEALAKIKKLEADKKALEEENTELKAKKKKADVESKLSQAGFSKNEQGEFDGVSTATMNMLLSASDEDSQAIITDLSKSLQLSQSDGKPNPPDFMFSETNPPSGDNGVQLSDSDNPLIANAKARISHS